MPLYCIIQRASRGDLETAVRIHVTHWFILGENAWALWQIQRHIEYWYFIMLLLIIFHPFKSEAKSESRSIKNFNYKDKVILCHLLFHFHHYLLSMCSCSFVPVGGAYCYSWEEVPECPAWVNITPWSKWKVGAGTPTQGGTTQGRQMDVQHSVLSHKPEVILDVTEIINVTGVTIRWCLRTGCWGERLDLRGRKWWEAGEDCIRRNFIT